MRTAMHTQFTKTNRLPEQLIFACAEYTVRRWDLNVTSETLSYAGIGYKDNRRKRRT